MDDLKHSQDDLLASVRQMKAGVAARRKSVPVAEVAEARSKVGASQGEFAKMLDVSMRTLREWEQGRRAPSGGHAC